MENYQENPENIERLEELLCKLGEKTSPPRSLSTGLRKKLIFHIEKEKESTVLKKVIQVLNLAQQVVRPGKDLVSRIRRRILDEISRPKPNWRESFSFVFDRRILAGATAFFLIFSLIYYSFENAPLISASKSAYLNLVEGVVFVKRDNEWKRLANNTELEKNDIVVTSSNSSAEIYFFDDSITRLNEKTEIQIKSLKSSQENPTQKSILIELHKGRIWSKAIHLLNEESSFNIQINNLLTTLNNAAVDIEHTPDEIRVTTAENFANIQVVDPWREITHKTKLTKNHEVKIPLRRSQLIVTNKGIPIKSVQKKTKEEEWFQENREKDKKHDSNFTLKKKLEAENKAGILPGSALYPAKKVVEQAKLALTFNKTARATAQLNIANTRLAEAVTLIEKGRNDSAKNTLEEYKEVVADAVFSTENLEKGETEKANEAIARGLQEGKKNLVLILPGSPLYEAKEMIREAEIVAAKEGKNKKEVEIANEKLLEIDRLVKNGSDKLAKKQLITYQEDRLKSERTDNKELLNEILIIKNATEIPLLETIKKTPSSDLQEIATEIQEENVEIMKSMAIEIANREEVAEGPILTFTGVAQEKINNTEKNLLENLGIVEGIVENHGLKAVGIAN